MKVSRQQWLEKAFKTLVHILCAITNLTLSKQDFSTAKQEARTFHCPHCQHMPSWLLVKKRPLMMKNPYITVSVGKTEPWPSALKTKCHLLTLLTIFHWETCLWESSNAHTAQNWSWMHSWAFQLTDFGDHSTGTKPKTFFTSTSHIQSHVTSFSKQTTKCRWTRCFSQLRLALNR